MARLRALWPSTRSPGRPGAAALGAGTVRFAGGWSGSPGPAEAAAARAQKRKFDSRCSDAESRNRKCRCGPHVWSVPWPAPTSKHCQPAAASTRPDDDDDHNAAASTTTTCPHPKGGGVWGDPSNGWLPISVRVVWGGGGGQTS